jgi:transcriptional regulator with XRE-family HTH domain
VTRKTISNRLFVLRAERRWTQTDVAKRLGFPTKFRYWQIENEQAAPTPDELKKLSKIFGKAPGEIFPSMAA